MKKRQWFISVFLFILVVSFTLPNFTAKAETEWQKLDRQLQQIQQEKKEAAARAKELDRQLEDIQQEQKSIEQELFDIDLEIDQTEEKLFALENDIEKVTNQAKIAAFELEEAIKRVEDRDALLKTRVQLMYRNGKVKYLEVLLGSNSFSDFLQRFDALEKIIDSDKKILQDNINDKNTIEAKKKEIDKALADLEKLYADAEEARASLMVQRKDRNVKMASLEQKEEEIAEYKEDEEQFIIEIAAKEAETIEKQQELLYNGGFFAWPVPESKRITSDFGMRIDPINGRYVGHTGLDIGHAPGKSSLYGADIVAAADGIVIVAYYVNGYGNTVIINHGGGIWTLYGHIRNGGIFVKVGQAVEKGDKIAEVGSTGRSTGPHLHFEVRKDQVPVNPWDYIK